MPDNQQPISADEVREHSAAGLGPASSPPVESLSGDPLDETTKAAMDPDRPTPLSGGSEPLDL